MAHAQKPDFVFRRNGRVHLNRQGRQFSRLLATEVCGLAVVMLDKPCSEVVWRVLATHSIRQFPFTSPPVRHRVPSHFNWTLLIALMRTNKVSEGSEIILGTQCVAFHVQRVSFHFVMAPSLLAVLVESAEFCVFCTVHCNIITQYEPTKCTFP
jgi:hypothetical protein